MVSKLQILEAAQAGLNQNIQIRRHLHAHPELSFAEHQTARFIAEQLTSMKIPFTEGVAGTGIVAHIEGKNPSGRVLALRADMDALPIQELNQTDYRSRNQGVMHACGHDVHTASLLGAARILTDLKSEFEGTVRLIFQPGEEKLPGGASLMIAEGVLKNPQPSAIYGQHVFPELSAGKVGFRPGAYMASADEIYVTVKGKGGHGALPHKNIDPVLITANLLLALQQVVSRYADPTIPSVLSFGKVIAEGATNVIPSEVRLEGTFRTFDEHWRNKAHQQMKDLAVNLVRSMGGECEFDIHKGYPFLINDPELTQRTRNYAEEFLGKENVVDLGLRMTAEDFAYYSQVIPACFYRLGTASADGRFTEPVHHPQFDIDEKALLTGAGLMAWLAISELQH